MGKSLWKVCMEIYRRMYKEAEPSADFDKMINNKDTMKKEFYLKHYLDENRQNEIIDEVCREFKVSRRDKRKVRSAVVLGSSPTAVSR